MKFHVWLFFENMSRKFKFHYNLTRVTGNLHEDLCAFMIISHSDLLRIRSVSNKSVEKIRNTHFTRMFTTSSRKLCLLWGRPNVENHASSLMTESYDTCEVAFWKAKATHTHTEYW